MTQEQPKAGTNNGEAQDVTSLIDDQKPKSVTDAKLKLLSELAASVQDEINSLGIYLSKHRASIESNSFDLSEGINLPEEMRRIESEIISYALRCTRGHQRRAAWLLGLKPSTLNAKIKMLGISPVTLKRPRPETPMNENYERDPFPRGAQGTTSEACSESNTFS